MAATREGVNPLRPYYIPPSIGEPEPIAHGNASSSYTHKARDIFADIDYTDYISEPSPSIVQSTKDVVDDLLWRYTSVLMSQPFEVARTLLQVRSQETDTCALATAATASDAEVVGKPKDSVYDSAFHNPFADDDDPDEPNYFAPYATNSASPLYPTSQKLKAPAPPQSAPAPAPLVPALSHQLLLQRSDSIMEVLSQLWQREGAWGMWKGSNASFLYTVLQSLFENWSRSLLSALFNVPDLGLKDDVDRLIDIASPYPWASLFVAASAAVATALVLSPLDLVRTRLIVTPTSRQPRRAISILRSLPSYACSPALVVPTVLHALIYPILTLSTPLVLRSRFAIDRDASPVSFSVAKFCSSSFALFVKLPLETVLRRGQASVLSSPEYVQALQATPQTKEDTEMQAADAALVMDTVVPLGPYSGVLGTMHHIVAEEGGKDVPLPVVKTKSKKNKVRVAETVYRRGQGMEGLWRGWKVSWWGLVGLWTAAAVGGGGDGRF